MALFVSSEPEPALRGPACPPAGAEVAVETRLARLFRWTAVVAALRSALRRLHDHTRCGGCSRWASHVVDGVAVTSEPRCSMCSRTK